MALSTKILRAVMRKLEERISDRADSPTTSTRASGSTAPPLVTLYSELIEIQRDQVAAQLERSSTNDLKAAAIVAAGLAIVVSLLVLRATDSSGIGYWWWYPLPLFVIPTGLTALPMVSQKLFRDGPHVPTLLAIFASNPKPLEEMLSEIIRDLQASWAHNDSLLKRESRLMTVGVVTLAVATTASLGLYTWALS